MTNPEGQTHAGPGARARPGMRRVWAPILESVRLEGNHHRLVLASAEVAGAAEPGQFLHVWCHPPEEVERPPCAAILRRPYSISRVRLPDEVEFLLRVRGTGGRLLAGRSAGEALDVIGPLGRGFRFGNGLRTAVVVAGGIGLAPVPFLVERLAARGVRVVLLAGARDDATIPFQVERPGGAPATIPELAALGAEVCFAAESVEGRLVSDLVEERLGDFSGPGVEMLAVGPRAMLKRLAEMTEGRVPLQVSLEERMACGVGACRSCVVPVRGEGGPRHKTVCRDGPVFDASEIDWERVES